MLTLFLSLALAAPARPQGCDQCREAVGQTPIRTQTAYRRAIILMILAGTTVFTAAIVTLRRYHR